MVRGLKYFHRKEQDNCPGGCGQALPAGESLDGFLRYDVFGLAPELYHEPKTLHFEASAWRSPRGTYYQPDLSAVAINATLSYRVGGRHDHQTVDLVY